MWFKKWNKCKDNTFYSLWNVCHLLFLPCCSIEKRMKLSVFDIFLALLYKCCELDFKKRLNVLDMLSISRRLVMPYPNVSAKAYRLGWGKSAVQVYWELTKLIRGSSTNFFLSLGQHSSSPFCCEEDRSCVLARRSLWFSVSYW